MTSHGFVDKLKKNMHECNKNEKRPWRGNKEPDKDVTADVTETEIQFSTSQGRLVSIH